MRVLITWASERGGTEGIARTIGETLHQRGFEVELMPVELVAKVTAFDAVVVGSALYASRWLKAARHFVQRQQEGLREIPVWFFSSGPLDDSADHQPIRPVRQVQALMDSVGAQGHRTFGGRLLADIPGLPTCAITGDWRNPDLIREWGADIADELPTARPRRAITPSSRSVVRFRRQLGH